MVLIAGCAQRFSTPVRERLVRTPIRAPEEPKQLPRLGIPDTQEVDRFVTHYTSVEHRFLEGSLERLKRHRRMIDRIFYQHGVPGELAYVALVESGVKSQAESPRGAVGLWQFMAATARSYGLNVTMFSDDRTSPVRSTEAVARYFVDLYKRYGDWQLAMAAYNGGTVKVNRAIRESGSREFFTLARRRLLYRETREFVPKVLAVAKICRDPKRYGLKEC